MFTRALEATLLTYAKFPVIAILGPRQSGKTTLVKNTFRTHGYASLEHPQTREMAEADPDLFFKLNEKPDGLIIDEFQLVPKLLSYIQLTVDTKKRPGYYVLTGSQNFLMNQAITQSLAGRVGILTLFPLSMHELTSNKIAPGSVDEVMFNGFYPRIYDERFAPTELYPSYIQTYIERDVRQLANVGDLTMFKKLIKLCAGRVGQLLNCSELSNELGISVPTVQRWISILEASYIIFLLQPYANNFNRRVIRHPKIYFYDTGLMSNLLGIESPERIAVDRLRGSVFENFIIADLYKQYSNIGKQASLYFWRDKNGSIEVDCIVDDGRKLHPIEIKSSETISLDFFANLKKWQALANAATIPLGRSHVFYGGLETKSLDELGTVGWHDMGTFVQRIRNEK